MTKTAIEIKNSKNLYRLSLATLAVVVLGSLLMGMKIYADSEPGAIPLLLILVGTSGDLITRLRIRSQKTGN